LWPLFPADMCSRTIWSTCFCVSLNSYKKCLPKCTHLPQHLTQNHPVSNDNLHISAIGFPKNLSWRMSMYRNIKQRKGSTGSLKCILFMLVYVKWTFSRQLFCLLIFNVSSSVNCLLAPSDSQVHLKIHFFAHFSIPLFMVHLNSGLPACNEVISAPSEVKYLRPLTIVTSLPRATVSNYLKLTVWFWS